MDDVVYDAGFAFGNQLLLQLGHKRYILAVGGDDHSQRFGQPHRGEQFGVIDTQRPLVCQENFERRKPGLDDLRMFRGNVILRCEPSGALAPLGEPRRMGHKRAVALRGA